MFVFIKYMYTYDLSYEQVLILDEYGEFFHCIAYILLYVKVE